MQSAHTLHLDLVDLGCGVVAQPPAQLVAGRVTERDGVLRVEVARHRRDARTEQRLPPLPHLRTDHVHAPSRSAPSMQPSSPAARAPQQLAAHWPVQGALHAAQPEGTNLWALKEGWHSQQRAAHRAHGALVHGQVALDRHAQDPALAAPASRSSRALKDQPRLRHALAG